MLESISIQNYALIDQLNINLSEGLNVITGETGAGKSIVISAISLLLGNRSSKDNIRKDQKKMAVSGLFSLSDSSGIAELLSDLGIDLEDGLILTREVDKNGRNVCRINGTIVPLTKFRELGNHLIDIHSQHEHVALFQPEQQRRLLDLYGGDDLINLKDQVREMAFKLRDLAKEIKKLQIESKEANRNYQRNLEQLNEITKAELIEGEEDELKQLNDKLAKQERLFFESSQAKSILGSQDNDSQSIDSLLSDLATQLEKLSKIDDSFKDYYQQLDSLIDSFNSLSFDLTEYLNNIDYEPEKLNEVQERLNLIDNLKKRYGNSIEEILKYADSLQSQVDLNDTAGFILDKSKKEYKTARKDYNTKAKELTEKRKQAALRLREELETELKDLAMDKSRVVIDIKTDTDLISPVGQDSVDFLISVNPGIEPRALKQVASGGEISRIMLAVKGIFGEKDQIETMIFDEIDTGISGRTAQVVAEKILNLSRKRQIICITHLPQIAAMADTQFLVQKKTDEDTTEVSFTELGEEERTEELARMISGAKTTDLTLKSANEMLRQASVLKNKI